MPEGYSDEFLDGLDCGVSIIDKDMKIIWVNRFLKNKGFEIDSVRGRPCHIVYKNQGRVCNSCPSMKSFETGETVRMIEKGADGKEYEVTAVPVKENGKTAKVMEFVREIHKIKDVQESLLESKDLYLLLAESMTEMVYMIDRDFRVIYVNSVGAKQFNAAERDITGKKLDEIFEHKIAEEHKKAVQGIFDTGRTISHEVYEKFPQGVKWIDARLSPVRDNEGKVIAVLGLSQDITKRRMAEEALKEREKRLAVLYDNVTDVIFYLNVEAKEQYRFQSVNPAFLKTTGLKASQVIGRLVSEVIPEPSLSLVLSNYRKAIQTRDSVCWEEETYYPTGNKIGEVIITPIFDEQGICTNLIGTVYDLTKRKRAEEALKESEEKYRVIFESANDIIILLDTKGKIIDVNRKLTEIIGYRRDELIGRYMMTFTDILTKKSLALLAKNFAKRVTGMELPPYEVDLYDKRRNIRTFEVNGIPIRKEGKMVGDLALFRDVTERKRIEEETRLQKEKIESIFNNTQFGIAIVDFNHHFIDANLRFCNILGYPLKELKGMTFRDFTHPDDMAESTRLVKKLMSGKIDTFSLEKRYIRKDKKIIYGSVRLSSIKDSSGKFLYNLISLEDITEQKKAEEAFKISETKYRKLFENAKDAIIIIDADSGEVIDANPYIRDVLGYSHKELLGKKVWEIGPLRAVISARDQFELLKKRKSVHYEDIPLMTKHRREAHVEFGSNVFMVNRKMIIQCNIRDITARKKAEDEFKISEMKYRRLFEASKDAILIIDADSGKIIDANPFIRDLLGYSLSEIVGKRLWQVSPLRDIIANKNKFIEMKKGKYLHKENLPLETKSGKKINVEFISNIYNVKDKKIIQCNMRDITARKKAEEELKESERSLNEAQRLSRLGNWSFDIATGKVTWSKELYELTEYDPKLPAPDYDKLKSFYTPESWKILYTSVQRAIKTGEPYNLELELVYKNGKHWWQLAKGKAIKDAGGKVVQLAGTIQDITARKKAEEGLKESESRFKELFDSMEECVVVYDVKDNGNEILIRDLNKSAEKLERVNKKDVIGKRVDAVFKGVKKFGLFDVFRKVWKTGKPMYHPVSFYNDAYHQGWRENYIFKLPSGEIVALYSDVTEKKEAENELKTAYEGLKKVDELKSGILRNVSHELKTPVALLSLATNNMIHELKKSYPNSQKMMVYLDMLKRNSRRFEREINSIVDFSRLSALSDIKKEKIDVGALISEVLREEAAFAGKKRITAVNKLGKGCVINANKEIIISLIRNLIHNAFKFTEKGCIEVRCSKINGGILLEIKDTGIGISAKDMPKMFTPFTQLDLSIQGTGLGLAICKRIAELHGGSISVKSRFGKGSTFIVKLPIKADMDKHHKI